MNLCFRLLNGGVMKDFQSSELKFVDLAGPFGNPLRYFMKIGFFNDFELFQGQSSIFIFFQCLWLPFASFSFALFM
jgi:hypothetical protein